MAEELPADATPTPAAEPAPVEESAPAPTNGIAAS